MTTRISATITEIRGQRAAVVECHDQNGTWLGGMRVEARGAYSLAPSAASKREQDRAKLYEFGYSAAAANAAAHGGILERFRWV